MDRSRSAAMFIVAASSSLVAVLAMRAPSGERDDRLEQIAVRWNHLTA
jgi:hypothetical protein